MSSPLSDTYPVADYMLQLSHISIPPLQQNDDNRLPALRGGTDCLTLTFDDGPLMISAVLEYVNTLRFAAYIRPLICTGFMYKEPRNEKCLTNIASAKH